jgi:hypothetical protein
VINALTAVLGSVLETQQAKRSEAGEDLVGWEGVCALPVVDVWVDFPSQKLAGGVAEQLVFGAETQGG